MACSASISLVTSLGGRAAVVLLLASALVSCGRVESTPEPPATEEQARGEATVPHGRADVPEGRESAPTPVVKAISLDPLEELLADRAVFGVGSPSSEDVAAVIAAAHPAALELLIRNLRHPNEVVRRAVFQGLAKYGEAASAALPDLIAFSVQDDTGIARGAIETLTLIAPSDSDVLALLHAIAMGVPEARDDSVRSSAVRALKHAPSSNHETARVLRAVIESEPHGWAQMDAVQSSATFVEADGALRETLVRLVGDNASAPGMSRLAAEVLGSSGPEGAHCIVRLTRGGNVIARRAMFKVARRYSVSRAWWRLTPACIEELVRAHDSFVHGDDSGAVPSGVPPEAVYSILAAQVVERERAQNILVDFLVRTTFEKRASYHMLVALQSSGKLGAEVAKRVLVEIPKATGRSRVFILRKLPYFIAAPAGRRAFVGASLSSPEWSVRFAATSLAMHHGFVSADLVSVVSTLIEQGRARSSGSPLDESRRLRQLLPLLKVYNWTSSEAATLHATLVHKIRSFGKGVLSPRERHEFRLAREALEKLKLGPPK